MICKLKYHIFIRKKAIYLQLHIPVDNGLSTMAHLIHDEAIYNTIFLSMTRLSIIINMLDQNISFLILVK